MDVTNQLTKEDVTTAPGASPPVSIFLFSISPSPQSPFPPELPQSLSMPLPPHCPPHSLPPHPTTAPGTQRPTLNPLPSLHPPYTSVPPHLTPPPPALTGHPGEDVSRCPPPPSRRSPGGRLLLGPGVDHEAAEPLDALGVGGGGAAAGGAGGGTAAGGGGGGGGGVGAAAPRAEQAALEALVLGEVVEARGAGEGQRRAGRVQRQQRVEAVGAHVQAAGARRALGPRPAAPRLLLRGRLSFLHGGRRPARR